MGDIGKLTARDLYVIARDGEPRIRDVRLGGRLAYEGRADNVRNLIHGNEDELRDYGTLLCREAKSIGGRPATEYWLNEGQAILICFLSRAANARPIRREIIEAFLAYRRGEHPTTPLTDALLAPAEAKVERDDNVLHVTHEDWTQPNLFDHAPSIEDADAPIKARVAEALKHGHPGTLVPVNEPRDPSHQRRDDVWVEWERDAQWMISRERNADGEVTGFEYLRVPPIPCSTDGFGIRLPYVNGRHVLLRLNHIVPFVLVERTYLCQLPEGINKDGARRALQEFLSL